MTYETIVEGLQSLADVDGDSPLKEAIPVAKAARAVLAAFRADDRAAALTAAARLKACGWAAAEAEESLPAPKTTFWRAAVNLGKAIPEFLAAEETEAAKEEEVWPWVIPPSY